VQALGGGREVALMMRSRFTQHLTQLLPDLLQRATTKRRVVGVRADYHHPRVGHLHRHTVHPQICTALYYKALSSKKSKITSASAGLQDAYPHHTALSNAAACNSQCPPTVTAAARPSGPVR